MAASPASWAQTIAEVDLDSPPTSESAGGRYTGRVGSITLDVRGGVPTNMFDHVTGAACWGGSGGCAKFYGSESGGGVYRGFTLGSYSGGPSRLNIRYLKKWNSNWIGNQRGLKSDFFTMGGNRFWAQQSGVAWGFGGFQMSQSHNGTLYRIHGNGQSQARCQSEGYLCVPYETNASLGPGVAAAGPFEYEDYVDQWVSLEFEVLSTGVFRIYIWTQDGRYNGLYMEARNMPTGTPAVTGFGGMYFHDSGASPGSFVMVDEVVVSESFIGPPPGFLSDAERPRSPTGVVAD
jgi:hypothetical protein